MSTIQEKNKIPTAQNFLRGDDCNEPWTGDVEEAMIEFAKMHVKAALEAIKEKGLVSFVPWDEEAWEQKEIERKDILGFYDSENEGEDVAYEQLRERDGFTIEINQESILNAYTEENII